MTIVQKQRQLQFLGYYNGKIDGLWGVKSVAATREFQKANGLEVDGKFGAKTATKTMQLVMDIQKTVGANIDGLVGSETYTKYNAWKEKQATSDKASDKTSGDFWSDIKYFQRSEFACKCGGKYCNGFPVEPDEALVRMLDKVRTKRGKPMHINSGIRCKQHNANTEGSSKTSKHMDGNAADVRITGVTPYALAKDFEELMPNTGGIGVYSWGVHVDTRPNKTRWNG